MSETFITQPDYQQRVTDILMTALMVELKDPVTGVAVWRTGEIIEAMRDFQAMLLAGSELATPTKIREYADDYAKVLRRKTMAFKEHFAKHGAPFPTYHIEGDLH
jgi:hypothetical protein